MSKNGDGPTTLRKFISRIFGRDLESKAQNAGETQPQSKQIGKKMSSLYRTIWLQRKENIPEAENQELQKRISQIRKYSSEPSVTEESVGIRSKRQYNSLTREPAYHEKSSLRNSLDKSAVSLREPKKLSTVNSVALKSTTNFDEHQKDEISNDAERHPARRMSLLGSKSILFSFRRRSNSVSLFREGARHHNNKRHSAPEVLQDNSINTLQSLDSLNENPLTSHKLIRETAYHDGDQLYNSLLTTSPSNLKWREKKIPEDICSLNDDLIVNCNSNLATESDTELRRESAIHESEIMRQSLNQCGTRLHMPPLNDISCDLKSSYSGQSIT